MSIWIFAIWRKQILISNYESTHKNDSNVYHSLELRLRDIRQLVCYRKGSKKFASTQAQIEHVIDSSVRPYFSERIELQQDDYALNCFYITLAFDVGSIQ